MATLDGDYGSIDPSGVSMWPTAMRYGVIAGVLSMILGLIMHLTGMVDMAAAAGGEGAGVGGMIQSIVGYAIWIGAVVMAVKYHRDSELGGYITFGRAFGTGFVTSLVMGVIGAVWTFVFFKFIAGDALDAIKEAAMENMSGDEVDVAGGMMDAMMSPGAMAGFAIAGSLIVGAILSLIVAAIMKKENPNTI